MDHPALLRALFDAAVQQAVPERCVPAHLPPPPKGRTVVVGAGKAAAAMAKAVEDNWREPLSGLVITRYGHAVSCRHIQVVEAAHPVPDAAGRDAAALMLETVSGLTEDDLVLCLISGGGSALLSLPLPGLELEDKQAVTTALLRSGANISEMNCVRKHLSAIKGGRLALACHPARVISLMISDVPGDDLSTIASGPTVADPTTLAEARAVLDKYGIQAPQGVYESLADGATETPKPGDSRLAAVDNRIIAAPKNSLAAAAEVARRAGVTPLILGDSIEGEAGDVGRDHAAIAQRIAGGGHSVTPPAVLLSGGETTVTIRGTGKGGPNTEYLLSLAIALDGLPNVFAIACDTDGADGTEDNAGARIDPSTLERAKALGVNPRERLEDNDAYGFFSALDDLVVTGPTLTNVNDFRAILIH